MSWLQHVGYLIFVAVCKIFSYSRQTLSCSRWDLVILPGIEPGSRNWERGVPATGPPGKSPTVEFFISYISLEQAEGRSIMGDLSLRWEWENHHLLILKSFNMPNSPFRAFASALLGHHFGPVQQSPLQISLLRPPGSAAPFSSSSFYPHLTSQSTQHDL